MPEGVSPIFGNCDDTGPVEDSDIETCVRSSHAPADHDEEEAAACELKSVVEVIGPTINTAPGPQLDSWTNYLERPIIWINPGPSSRPLAGAVV